MRHTSSCFRTKMFLGLLVSIGIMTMSGCGSSPESDYKKIVESARQKDWGAVYDSIDKKSQGEIDAGLKMMIDFAATFGDDEKLKKELKSLSGKELFIRLCEDTSDEMDIIQTTDYEIIKTEKKDKEALLTVQYKGEEPKTVVMILEDNRWKLNATETEKIEKALVEEKEGYNKIAKNDITNTAVAQEAYYVDNNRFANSIKKLVGGNYGLYLSKNVKLHTSSYSKDQKFYVAAFHSKGDKIFGLYGPGGAISIESKETILINVAMEDDYDFIKGLLAIGADVNAKDKDGFTPLIFAAISGHTSIVKELIANGADINAKEKDGVTPLIYAVSEGHTNTVKELIAKGADVNAKMKNGGTSLQLAKKKGHTKIAKLLRDAGARE